MAQGRFTCADCGLDKPNAAKRIVNRPEDYRTSICRGCYARAEGRATIETVDAGTFENAQGRWHFERVKHA